jgi:hypothetical protein
MRKRVAALARALPSGFSARYAEVRCSPRRSCVSTSSTRSPFALQQRAARVSATRNAVCGTQQQRTARLQNTTHARLGCDSGSTYSLVSMAGAGRADGMAYGSSDRHNATPCSRRALLVLHRVRRVMAPTTVAALPHALLRNILARLPVDERMRCAEVCRAWRAVLEDTSLWARLDLSAGGGVTHCVTDALLRAACARAGDAIRFLDVAGCASLTYTTLIATLGAALAAGARELRATGTHTLKYEVLEPWLASAPQLELFSADVDAQAQAMLRNQHPFAALRVGALEAECARTDAAATLQLAAGFAAHASLTRCELVDADALQAPAVLNVVVDAALERRLESLTLRNCCLLPPSLPVWGA